MKAKMIYLRHLVTKYPVSKSCKPIARVAEEVENGLILLLTA
jgi:hypothetical protein